jgi:ABC-type nitrate/sulfonate/bicarbonate transport system permease component
MPANILPAPSIIIYSLIVNFKLIWMHILVTVFETSAGFAAAVFFGMFTAIIMDGIPFVKKVLYPLIVTSQTIPIITVAPLFIIWFGYGYLPKIIIVILICFFPISVSFLQGLGSVDPDLINLLNSMGAGRYLIFRIVKFPASLPNLFSGLKIAATYSIMGATIGEWVGGKDGIGVYMLRAKFSFATDKVFGAIIIITLLSLALLKIIEFIEKKSMPWADHDKNEIMI